MQRITAARTATRALPVQFRVFIALTYPIIALVLLLLVVASYLAIVSATEDQRAQLLRTIEARARTLESRSWARPVVSGVARDVDAHQEVEAALALLDVAPDEPPADTAVSLARSSDALDALIAAATASRLRGRLCAPTEMPKLRRALDLLSARARTQDGPACLKTSLAALRLSLDAEAMYDLSWQGFQTELPSCVPRAHRADVARAAAAARRLVTASPLEVRHEREPLGECEAVARVVRLDSKPVVDWPWKLLRRRRYFRFWTERCAPGVDTQAFMIQEGTGYDSEDHSSLLPLHALVLVMEAAAGQMPRVGDTFATDLVLVRRADGTVEAHEAGKSADAPPFELECAPPGSALAGSPSP